MKNLFFTFLLFISILFFSCSENNSTNPSKTLDKNLIGNWACTEIIKQDSLLIDLNIQDVNAEYGGNVNLLSVQYTESSGSTMRIETTLKGTLSLEYNYPNIKIKRGVDPEFFFTGTIDTVAKTMTGKIISLNKNVILTKK